MFIRGGNTSELITKVMTDLVFYYNYINTFIIIYSFFSTYLRNQMLYSIEGGVSNIINYNSQVLIL